MKANLKKLPKSQIEVDFKLTAEEFNKYIDRALERLKSYVKMEGFRPGHVPKELAEKRVGQENLLMEAGDLAVKDNYTKFVNENNLEPIGQPQVKILKIAKGSEFLFSVNVSVLPEIELPDYKKIASQVKAKEISVEEKEIEDAINYLQKSRAKFSQVDRGAEENDFVEIEYQSKDINTNQPVKDRFILGQAKFMKGFEDNLAGMKAGEEKEFNLKFPENTLNNLRSEEGKFRVKMISVQEMELPEVSDEFAKSLGIFDSLAALKNNLREGITMEKQEAEKQRKREEILSKISEKIRFQLPEKMVEYEEKKMLEDLKNSVAQNFRITLEEYLKSIKKTEQELKKSFRQRAEKRVKNFLILRQIGKAENTEVSNGEMEAEINKIVKNYSKEQLGKIDINKLKEYTKGTIYNEKVFEKLESFSKI